MTGMSVQGGAGSVLEGFLAAAAKDESTVARLKQLKDAAVAHDAAKDRAQAAVAVAQARHAEADKREKALGEKENNLAAKEAEQSKLGALYESTKLALASKEKAVVEGEKALAARIRQFETDREVSQNALNAGMIAHAKDQAEHAKSVDMAKAEIEEMRAAAMARIDEAAAKLSKDSIQWHAELSARERGATDRETEVQRLEAEYEQKLAALRGIVG